jgi:tetratricopeptide (TPR) repeat protein
MAENIRVEELWSIAEEFIKSNSPWKARDILKTILAAYPAHAAARAELAAIFQAEGDLDLALVHAVFAHRLNPDLPNLSRRCADLYFVSGFYEEALALYEDLVRADERDRAASQRLLLCKEIVDVRRSEGEDEAN